MISVTGKEPLVNELVEELLEDVLSFFEHPPTRSRVAVSRMNAVRQKLSFIFMTYLNYYFLSISVCLIRPIGLTTTFVLYASFSSVIVPPAAKPKALNEGQRVALIKMFVGTFSL